MATWENMEKEQESTESQEEEEIVANLCFIADIVSEEEIKISDSEPEISYENL